MTGWIQEVLTRYGQAVVLETAEGKISAQALLQPVTERREQADGAVTEIGRADGRLWRYLGREKVEPGDTLEWDGMAFQVRSSRPYYIGEALSHWWASLERKWEAAE